MQRKLLYFIIAAGPPLIQVNSPPATPWEWFKLCMASLIAGCVALRALQSSPDTPAEAVAPTVKREPSTLGNLIIPKT